MRAHARVRERQYSRVERERERRICKTYKGPRPRTPPHPRICTSVRAAWLRTERMPGDAHTDPAEQRVKVVISVIDRPQHVHTTMVHSLETQVSPPAPPAPVVSQHPALTPAVPVHQPRSPPSKPTIPHSTPTHTRSVWASAPPTATARPLSLRHTPAVPRVAISLRLLSRGCSCASLSIASALAAAVPAADNPTRATCRGVDTGDVSTCSRARAHGPTGSAR